MLACGQELNIYGGELWQIWRAIDQLFPHRASPFRTSDSPNLVVLPYFPSINVFAVLSAPPNLPHFIILFRTSHLEKKNLMLGASTFKAEKSHDSRHSWSVQEAPKTPHSGFS